MKTDITFWKCYTHNIIARGLDSKQYKVFCLFSWIVYECAEIFVSVLFFCTTLSENVFIVFTKCYG